MIVCVDEILRNYNAFLFFILSYFLAGIAIKPTERVWDEQKRFIQDASHDLKTPITVILANTEIVEAHSEDRVRDVTGWLESTKDEAERMKRLVQSMLELAKTDDLSEPLEIYDVDVSDLIEQTALQMEPLAFEKQINVETHIEPQLIAKSNGDSFTRIVHVLIDNGLKYAAKDTTLRISLTRERRGICFSVHNDGSFIKAEDIPHIFERFYRSDKARGKGGFGLGLSIAKSLCDKMKAEISCESSEEVGTTFTVTLPPTDKNPLTYFIKK